MEDNKQIVPYEVEAEIVDGDEIIKRIQREEMEQRYRQALERHWKESRKSCLSNILGFNLF